MKVSCPFCKAEIPARDINLESGWGKCEACNEVFPLKNVLPGYTEPAPARDKTIERPFNARAIVQRSADELVVHVPAEGMRTATCGLLGFALFWQGFNAFWTLGALGVFAGNQQGAFNWIFAAFSIPFWIVGFGMLGAVLWKARGTKSLRIDSNEMITQWRCLAFSRTRQIELRRVQQARIYEPQVIQNGVRPIGIEIVYEKGSFVLPADSSGERDWLIFEINGFLHSARR